MLISRSHITMGNQSNGVALVKADWLDYNPTRSGRGSARLERTVRVREVPSSNLGAPTFQVRMSKRRPYLFKE
jgi:hypothetical protein